VRSIAAGMFLVTWCLLAASAMEAPPLPVDRAAIMADQKALAARAGEADPARHAEAAALVDEGVKLHDAAAFDAALAKYMAATEKDTAKSMEVHREWLALAPPRRGPGGLRRPEWFARAVRPSAKAYRS